MIFMLISCPQIFSDQTFQCIPTFALKKKTHQKQNINVYLIFVQIFGHFDQGFIKPPALKNKIRNQKN